MIQDCLGSFTILSKWFLLVDPVIPISQTTKRKKTLHQIIPMAAARVEQVPSIYNPLVESSHMAIHLC